MNHRRPTYPLLLSRRSARQESLWLILLPYTPLAGPLGFAPLPLLYFLFLAGVMVVYLLLVELVKRRLMRRYA